MILYFGVIRSEIISSKSKFFYLPPRPPQSLNYVRLNVEEVTPSGVRLKGNVELIIMEGVKYFN